MLVEEFLERLGAELQRSLRVSPDAMAGLLAHDWPGNVRELRNVLERGAVVAQGDVIRSDDLGLGASGSSSSPLASLSSLEEVEKRHITEVLARCSGNVSQSARVLGIDRVTLYNKIKKYQLKRDGESADRR